MPLPKPLEEIKQESASNTHSSLSVTARYAAFMPDKKYIVTVSFTPYESGSIYQEVEFRVWDFQTKKLCFATKHPDFKHVVYLIKNNKLFIANNKDKSFSCSQIYMEDKKIILHRLWADKYRRYSGNISCIALTSKDLLVTGDVDGFLQVWDNNGDKRNEFSSRVSANKITAMTLVGDKFLILGDDKGQIFFIDIHHCRGHCLMKYSCDQSITSIIRLPANIIAFSDSSGRIHYMEINNFEILFSQQVSDSGFALIPMQNGLIGCLKKNSLDFLTLPPIRDFYLSEVKQLLQAHLPSEAAQLVTAYSSVGTLFNPNKLADPPSSNLERYITEIFRNTWSF